MTLLRMADAEAYISYLEQTPARSRESAQRIADSRHAVLPRTRGVCRARQRLPAGHRHCRRQRRFAPGSPGARPAKRCTRWPCSSTKRIGDRLGEARVQIFGTDVSESAVEYARHGLYPPSIAADVTPERLRRFFTRGDGGYRVTKSLRDMCVFARQDLTRDPPFSRLDLICCRNVLIYMDMRAAEEAAVDVSLCA